jgi:hypothetical protein
MSNRTLLARYLFELVAPVSFIDFERRQHRNGLAC